MPLLDVFRRRLNYLMVRYNFLTDDEPNDSWWCGDQLTDELLII